MKYIIAPPPQHHQDRCSVTHAQRLRNGCTSTVLHSTCSFGTKQFLLTTALHQITPVFTPDGFHANQRSHTIALHKPALMQRKAAFTRLHACQTLGCHAVPASPCDSGHSDLVHTFVQHTSGTRQFTTAVTLPCGPALRHHGFLHISAQSSKLTLRSFYAKQTQHKGPSCTPHRIHTRASTQSSVYTATFSRSPLHDNHY